MKRSCLRCRKPFESASKSNRICKRCAKRKLDTVWSGHWATTTKQREGLKQRTDKLTGESEDWKTSLKRETRRAMIERNKK